MALNNRSLVKDSICRHGPTRHVMHMWVKTWSHSCELQYENMVLPLSTGHTHVNYSSSGEGLVMRTRPGPSTCELKQSW